jgi:hypothetical protein
MNRLRKKKKKYNETLIQKKNFWYHNAKMAATPVIGTPIQTIKVLMYPPLLSDSVIGKPVPTRLQSPDPPPISHRILHRKWTMANIPFLDWAINAEVIERDPHLRSLIKQTGQKWPCRIAWCPFPHLFGFQESLYTGDKADLDKERNYNQQTVNRCMRHYYSLTQKIGEKDPNLAMFIVWHEIHDFLKLAEQNRIEDAKAPFFRSSLVEYSLAQRSIRYGHDYMMEWIMRRWFASTKTFTELPIWYQGCIDLLMQMEAEYQADPEYNDRRSGGSRSAYLSYDPEELARRVSIYLEQCMTLMIARIVLIDSPGIVGGGNLILPLFYFICDYLGFVPLEHQTYETPK